MKWAALITIALSAAYQAIGLTAEVRHTHSIFYPGVQQQAVMQIKITGANETIKAFHFNVGKTSRPSDIRTVRLCTCDNWNGYSLNTPRYIVEQAKGKYSDKGTISFKHKVTLGEAPLYVWISYDLAEKARRNGRIDAVCSAIELADGEIVTPEVVCGDAVPKRQYGRVYRFPYRVVPYYRPRWVKGWGNAEKAVHLTPAHFNLFTDIIHFAYTVTAEGNVDYQWAGEGVSPATVSDEALKELKRLHSEAQSRANIIAGFGHMDGPMTAAVATPELRRKLARNMAEWAISRGYNGIDIDWEYPDTEQQWNNFGYFLADLREELAGSGLSISIAASVTYRPPTYWATDQLDFLMTMSYDDLTPNHASMQRFQGDAERCARNFHMPKPRIVIGLPFYSNEKCKLTQQFGYSQILSWHPRIRPDVNEFISKNKDGSDGPVHSFNGPKLITEKCRWVKRESYGGVMIWAYDTDVPLTHKASLARAMYKIIRQPQKKQ